MGAGLGAPRPDQGGAIGDTPGEGWIAAKDVLYGRAKLDSSSEKELRALAVDNGECLNDVLEFAMEHDLTTVVQFRRR